MSTRIYRLITLLVLLVATNVRGAQAQLATSFYNVTGIQTRTLPNALRIEIRTDGALRFGSDLDEWIDFSDFRPKPSSAFRIRLAGARSKLPAVVNIGAYPVESAVVTPGRASMNSPYFDRDNDVNVEPRVDIEFRFFVPVRLQRFALDDNDDITFSRALNPLEVSVELGQDKRSIVITVVPDRADFNATARLQRSPKDRQRHRLSVSALAPDVSTQYRVDALHVPLRELLDVAAQTMKLQFVSENGTGQNLLGDLDITMFLPSVAPPEFLAALRTAYDLTFTPISDNGAFLVGRGGAVGIERIELKHLSPERARLFLPDFLLPLLRADTGGGALLISATPAVVVRVRRDLARLDLPRVQIRVEATAWELSSSDDMNAALRASRTARGDTTTFDTATGAFTFETGRNEARVFQGRLEALVSKGRARLMAKPFVVVASGETGTLFLGQSRFIQVIQQVSGVNTPRALRVQIGYTLTVTPRAGADDDISLDMAPRISTVDDIEPITGLPTIGIREVNSMMRVRPGDAVIFAGINSDLRFSAQRRNLFSRLPVIGRLFGSSRRSNTQGATIFLVTARKV